MSEKSGTEYRVKFIRRVVEQISFHRRQQWLHKEEQNHAAADNRERWISRIAYNLVDNNLRYERHSDSHKLQEKRGRQNLKQRFFIMYENFVKPIDIKSLFEISPTESRRKYQKFIRPAFKKLFYRQGKNFW